MVDSFIGCIGRMDHHVMADVVGAAAEALKTWGWPVPPLHRKLSQNARDFHPPQPFLKEITHVDIHLLTNGRQYAAPKTCAVVICLDGCEPEYLDVAIAEGLMPNLERIRAEGTDRIAFR